MTVTVLRKSAKHDLKSKQAIVWISRFHNGGDAMCNLSCLCCISLFDMSHYTTWLDPLTIPSGCETAHNISTFCYISFVDRRKYTTCLGPVPCFQSVGGSAVFVQGLSSQATSTPDAPASSLTQVPDRATERVTSRPPMEVVMPGSLQGASASSAHHSQQTTLSSGISSIRGDGLSDGPTPVPQSFMPRWEFLTENIKSTGVLGGCVCVCVCMYVRTETGWCWGLCVCLCEWERERESLYMKKRLCAGK